ASSWTLIALSRIALDMHDLLREVDRACGPDLKAVDPRVGRRRREQGNVLAQTGDGAPWPLENDAIGVERDPVSIVGGNLRVNVQVESAVCADSQIVDATDLAHQLRSD